MPTRSDGIDRPMPRATRRRPRWLAFPDRIAAGPSAEPDTNPTASRPVEPARGDDESCYALVVDVDPTGAIGLLGAPEEEPCYALVVDVTDPGESAADAPVVRLVPPRPGRPELHPVGPPRPVRHHRDDRTRPTRPGGHRPDPDRVLPPVTLAPSTLPPIVLPDERLDPLDGLLHPLREADDHTADRLLDDLLLGPAVAPGLDGAAPIQGDGVGGDGVEGDGAEGDGAEGAGPGGSRGPRLAVDPRIRARWIAVRRAEGRRRLRVLIVLVGLLTLATLAVAAVYSPLLDVERVDVSGVDATTAAAVRAAAGVSEGDALLRVNPGDVAARVERLPGIGHVDVSRDLPGTLDISVTRRELVGWVSVPAPKGSHAAATVATVDPAGRIVDAALVPPSGLPQLAGVSTRGRPGTRIAHPAVAHVASILPPDLRNLATTLTLHRGVVSMGLSNGPEIRFGAPDALAAKGRTALAILGSLRRPVHYIDVRVPSAPVTG